MAGARVDTQRLEPAGQRERTTERGPRPEEEAWLRLRPRGIGELIDQCFAVYVAYFGALVGISFLCFVPLHLLFDALLLPIIQRQGLEPIVALLRDVIPASITGGLVTLVVGQRLLGQEESLGVHLRRLVPRLPGLLVFYFLRGGLTLVLCCFLVVPGALSLWFFSPALAVYLLEGRAIARQRRDQGQASLPLAVMMASLGRSFRLSWNLDAFGRFLGVACVAGFLISLPLLGITHLQESGELRNTLLSSGALDARSVKVIMVLLGSAGVAAGAVFFDIFFTLYYFDLRVRREALDLDLSLDEIQRRSQKA